MIKMDDGGGAPRPHAPRGDADGAIILLQHRFLRRRDCKSIRKNVELDNT